MKLYYNICEYHINVFLQTQIEILNNSQADYSKSHSCIERLRFSCNKTNNNTHNNNNTNNKNNNIILN